MKKTILSLEGVEVLSKKQKISIIGGISLDTGEGSCCALIYRTCGLNGDRICSSTTCGHDSSTVQSLASSEAGGGRWCCKSCETASWL